MEENILKLIYKFYPRNIDSNVDYWYTTNEFNRLKNSIKVATNNIVNWNSFIDRLRKNISSNFLVEDWTQFHNHDACYTCRLTYSSLEGVFITVVINVSVISNFYSLYCSKIIKLENKYTLPVIDFDLKLIPVELIDKVESAINSSFSNYTKFPREFVEKKVVDISLGNKNYGEVTYFDCIFTTHIW